MPANKFTLGAGMGRVGGHYGNTRDILMTFGVGSYNALMAQQIAFMIPRTTDPDAQATILMVEAVQNGLNMLGAGIPVNGELDEATVKCLRKVSGSNWHAKTWVQILGDISDRALTGQKVKSTGPKKDLSEYVDTGMNTNEIVDAAFSRPARIGGAAGGAFHGYRRTGSIGFALFYAALGYINPPIGGAIMIAQGFGKGKGQQP